MLLPQRLFHLASCSKTYKSCIRSNPVAHSISITPSLDRARGSSCRIPRSARAISSSLPRQSANIASALTMRCRRLRRNWLILRLPYASPSHDPLNGVRSLTVQGGKRTTSSTSLATRCQPRTSLRARRIHLQALRAIVHHLAQPEVFPDAREPELQHRAQYRTPYFQL